MDDPIGDGARYVSRAGNHRLAEILFQRSFDETGNPHSAINVVYERYLQGLEAADKLRKVVFEYELQNGSHGKWLLKQIEGK